MVHSVHQFIWGPWLLLLILGIGAFFTVKSNFFQILGWKTWWTETVGSLKPEEKDSAHPHSVTQFQSACTALAATVGTGNIVGVATALCAGGPGALFWMWISAGIGMMTAYAETVLGILYRMKRGDGSWLGGPMVYLEKGLGMYGTAVLYSFFAVLASLGMGSMVQSNSIAETLDFSFSVSPLLTGIVLTILILFVIRGGLGRIAKVAERLVPVSAGIYMAAALIVIISYYERIPSVLSMIAENAFRPASAAAGAAGYGFSLALRYGVSRGVFSNEAGLGSLAVIHGAVENTTPEKQGMWAMFEVFFDTIISCTLTALVILCVTGESADALGLDGAALTAHCFSEKLGEGGELLVSLAMLSFAFATIIAWYFLGKQNLSYLASRTGVRVRTAEAVYMVVYLNAVFIGCIARLETVWELSDIWNGLMAVPNVIALILLRKKITFPGKKRIDKRGQSSYTRTNKRE